jgi:hypothetical protein
MKKASQIKRIISKYFDPWGMVLMGVSNAPFNRKKISRHRDDIKTDIDFHATRIWPRRPILKITYQ